MPLLSFISREVSNSMIIKQLKVPKSIPTQKGDIVFSDEKLFTVEAKFNPQNDRVLAKKRDNIPEHLKTVYRRQNRPRSWFGRQSPKRESHPSFPSNKARN